MRATDRPIATARSGTDSTLPTGEFMNGRIPSLRQLGQNCRPVERLEIITLEVREDRPLYQCSCPDRRFPLSAMSAVSRLLRRPMGAVTLKLVSAWLTGFAFSTTVTTVPRLSISDSRVSALLKLP